MEVIITVVSAYFVLFSLKLKMFLLARSEDFKVIGSAAFKVAYYISEWKFVGFTFIYDYLLSYHFNEIRSWATITANRGEHKILGQESAT